MSKTEIQLTIVAPRELVFESVAHTDMFERVIPHVIKVEILSEQKNGLGTRFKETRRMGKREVTTELEVTEYEFPEQVRLVSESAGTLWDTIFTLRQEGDKTELKMVMEATAPTLMAKVMSVLIKGMVVKSISQDMVAIKQFCEAHALGDYLSL